MHIAIPFKLLFEHLFIIHSVTVFGCSFILNHYNTIENTWAIPAGVAKNRSIHQYSHSPFINSHFTTFTVIS